MSHTIQTDPISDKTEYLKDYLAQRQDMLVVFVKYYGKVKDSIKGAELAAIDSKSLVVDYSKMNGGSGTCVVPINPPLLGYEYLKPRLGQMRDEAEKGLGIYKPLVPTFGVPLSSILGPLAIGGLLTFLQFPPANFAGTAAGIVSFIPGGKKTVRYAWGTLAVVHGVSGLYAARIASGTTGVFVGAQYFLSTLLFGPTVVENLQERIENGKIAKANKLK